ncbi:ZN783 protein, partial [Pteruthius melanotis]|nr:ZN783 protein [Pteruthius melanotis]
STISLWTVVAAVQALERSVAAHASRLFSLEHRAGNSEKKHLDCEKMVGEFGNQLESKCAALGTLVQEYGRLQRRLENMENMLKNRNLWILRLPPGVEAPAAALENDATGFSTQEWGNLEEWQRELYGKVLTGKREAPVLLDDVISEPALLSRLQGGEAPCSEEEAAPAEIPAEPGAGKGWMEADCSIPEASFAVTVKQEEEEEPYAKEQGAMEGVEFSELGVEDSIIQIKQEQELCTANRKEEEAAEAPGEPCPGFYEPEAPGQARKGSEVDARELPGTEGGDL